MNNIFNNKKLMGIIGIIILLISVGFIVFTIVNKKEPNINDDVDTNKVAKATIDKVLNFMIFSNFYYLCPLAFAARKFPTD